MQSGRPSPGSATISFPCPQCGKGLKIKEEFAGKKGKCPQCGHAMRIPSLNAGAAVADLRTLAPSSPVVAGTVAAEVPAVSPCPPQELYDFLAPAQEADELGRLGSYRVMKVLGAGGMGVVFQAEDPQLKRQVALKALLPSLAASPSARQRFVREAQAAASLEHDHIIPIYQVGEDRGLPFMAMPLLKGQPLDSRLEREPQPPLPEVLRIGREIARGLAAAHDRGLIHRDVKPANIWLEAETGRVKILDFGLARGTSDGTQLTQAGAIIGTPAFMAPEQSGGKGVDGRCDLFSLGCILYRMTTGQLPFQAPDTISMLVAVATDTPRSPALVNPAVPPALSGLIMQLLAKKPEERPASARAVAEALEAIEREPQPAAATPQQTVTQPPPFAELKPTLELPAKPKPRAVKRKPAKAAPPIWPWVAGVGGGLALLLLLLGVLFSKKGPVVPPEQNPPDQQLPGAVGPGREVAQDPDRAAAEWVLKIGGRVEVVTGKGAGAVEVSEAASLPAGTIRLTKVNLANNKQVTDAGLKLFAGLDGLQTLTLNGTPVTDAGLEHLQGLKKLRGLELNATRVNGTGLGYLRNLPGLQWLYLNDTAVTEASLDNLKGLAGLRWLSLYGTKVSDAGVNRLKAELPQCQVASDSHAAPPKGTPPPPPPIGAPDADRRAAEWVLHVGGNVHIVSPPSVVPRRIIRLTDLPRVPFKVVNIALMNNGRVRDQGLANLRGLTSLEGLFVGGASISDAGMKNLKDLRSLKKLGLKGVSLTDKGLEELAGLTGLVLLNVNDSKVNDAGLKHLRSMRSLEWLGLENTNVTDIGLDNLRNLTTLQALYLVKTQITDKGLDRLRGLRQLQTLALQNTAVTPRGVRRLKMALPQCNITTR
jgi:serine/threonine protein kinase